MYHELPKLDNSNLWDRTYNILKGEIINRHFQPDEKLSIPEISEKLGVSRTPVRDALNRLEMEGLVITKPKVGTYIVAIDEELINSVMDTRLMIEFWSIDKIPKIDEDKLKQVITKMEHLAAEATKALESSIDKYYQSDYNLKFHLEIIKLANNQKNVEIYNSVMNYRLPVTVPKLVPSDEAYQAVHQHELILKAFKEKNLEAMRAATEQHLEDAKNRIIKKIRDNGGKI